jgi:RNA polymerase sigma factor (sigma-70 family)
MGTMTSLALRWAPGVSARPRADLGDETLALRIKAGDQQAFALIYERYHQSLFRYCRSVVRNDSDAQDALQSTFERALAALARGQRNAPLRPWLFRIAHNESITLIRTRGRELPASPLGADCVASAEQQVAERTRLTRLFEDMGDLPERLRSALIMRELEDLSHADIGVALGISPGAAKQAIFEARRALQDSAEGRAMACDDVRRKISDGDGRALRGRRVRAHLRDCAGCAGFAAAIADRRADLRALVPGLPPLAAAAIFARASGSLSVSGGTAGVGVGAGAGGGALGKGIAAAVMSSKLATGAAVLATAAAGAGGVAEAIHLAGPAPAVHRSAVHAPRGAQHGSLLSPASGAAHAGAASSASGRRALAVRSRGAQAGQSPSVAGASVHSASARPYGADSASGGRGAGRQHGAAVSSARRSVSATAPGLGLARRGQGSAAGSHGSAAAAGSHSSSSAAHAHGSAAASSAPGHSVATGPSTHAAPQASTHAAPQTPAHVASHTPAPAASAAAAQPKPVGLSVGRQR